MIESVQRGNVTIITALTSLLIVMITVFGTAISNQASNATRIQTSSDTAALAAAESYIGVINDEVAFDIIDWGLGFIQRLAQLLEDIGDAIEAIPYVGGGHRRHHRRHRASHTGGGQRRAVGVPGHQEGAGQVLRRGETDISHDQRDVDRCPKWLLRLHLTDGVPEPGGAVAVHAQGRKGVH